MTFRPGKVFLFIASALLILPLAAFAYPWVLTYAAVIAAGLVAAVVVDFLLLRKELSNITVERTMPAMAARGRNFPVKIFVKGSGGQWIADVRDVLPSGSDPQLYFSRVSLSAGSTQIRYTSMIARRGHYKFGRVWLRVHGKLGMLEASRAWPAEASIRIMPESLFPKDELEKDALDEEQLLDQITRTDIRGQGTEFESLAEYRPGEDVRRIDWRSTARSQRLILRRYQVEQHREIMILIDTGRLMGTAVGNGTKLDCAVNAALVISRVALQGGDRCGLGIFDSQVRGYLAPVAGAVSHKAIVERLYSLEPSWSESNFGPMFATLQTRLLKRAFVIVLSDMMDQDTTERYRSALTALRSRHQVLFAALQSPLLTSAAYAKIDEPSDAVRKTFALRLQRERQQVLHRLKRSGVEILDTDPRQLTVPLLNLYIKTRQGSVI